MPRKQPGGKRSGGNRNIGFVLSPQVERELLAVLHEVEMEKAQRATWDEAFRRLLAMAGRPVEEDEPQ